MELRHLRYFLKIAELSNLSRAAEKVFVSQSTLSHALNQLEKELGTLLFDRVGRNIRLTQEGRVFRDYAARTINEATRGVTALRELRDMEGGTFNLGAIPAFPLSFLPQTISAFNKSYPKVHIAVHDLRAAALEEMLAIGALDLGIAFHPASHEEVESEYLFTERMVLVVERRHPLAQKRRLQWKSLDAIPLALFTAKFSVRALIEESFKKAGAQLNVLIEMDTVETLIAIAADGQLGTIVPERAVSANAKVRSIRIAPPELSRQLGLLWPKGAGRTRAALTFAQMLKDGTLGLRRDA